MGFVVGILSWAGPAAHRTAPTAGSGPTDEDVQVLATRLGEMAYDTRLRLVGAPPVVLGPFDGVDAARDLLALLRDRGHGAVACDLGGVVPSSRMVAPSRVRFDVDALTAVLADGTTSSVPYREIVALVRGTHQRVSRTEETVRTKKTSIARAAMTGGVVLSKSETRTERSSDVETEHVLYVYRRANEHSVLLRERALKYEGEQLALTTGQNFDRLVEELAVRVPHAPLDERLVTQKRRATSLHAATGSNRSVIEQSNEPETDLAAHLIALGHLERQLGPSGRPS